MKDLLTGLWAVLWKPLKLTGLVFLAVYLYSHPVVFSPSWALAYFAIAVVGANLYGWLFRSLAKYSKKYKEGPHYIDVDVEAQYMIEHFFSIKKDSPVFFWLAPAESAFFYVPLLYVGINPLSAAVAAALFGFIHYPQHLPRNCLAKALLQYLLIFLILPHGILTMMAGHFLLDYVPLMLLKWLDDDEEELQETE